MNTMIIGIVLLIVGVIALLIGIFLITTVHSINKNIDKENNKLLEYNKELKKDKELITTELVKEQDILDSVHRQIQEKEKALENEYKKLNTIREDINKQIEESSNIIEKNKTMSQNAFITYCDNLDKLYQEKEEEYNELMKILDNAYENKQTNILNELENINADLVKARQTRQSIQEAVRREEEIRNNLDFYCLKITEAEIGDIQFLESIKSRMSNSRVISKLIWSEYYQKIAKVKFVEIINSSTPITGIYKITNQIDGKCYIGQAVDLAKRWTDHAKCGCDLDRPAKNKLYAAMVKDGLYNFSFEILEVCPRDQLDEKEKFYINLYDSYNFGYNSNIGNS